LGCNNNERFEKGKLELPLRGVGMAYLLRARVTRPPHEEGTCVTMEPSQYEDVREYSRGTGGVGLAVEPPGELGLEGTRRGQQLPCSGKALPGCSAEVRAPRVKLARPLQDCAPPFYCFPNGRTQGILSEWLGDDAGPILLQRAESARPWGKPAHYNHREIGSVCAQCTDDCQLAQPGHIQISEDEVERRIVSLNGHKRGVAVLSLQHGTRRILFQKATDQLPDLRLVVHQEHCGSGTHGGVLRASRACSTDAGAAPSRRAAARSQNLSRPLKAARVRWLTAARLRLFTVYIVTEPPCARLLVVDNEDMVRTLFARMLRDCGYDVVEAANGRVALELLAATATPHFDLIVTNSVLPGVPGVEFIRTVLVEYPHIRVLHVTGDPESVEDRRIEGFGVATLVKPLSQQELAQAVERCLQGGGEKKAD
jgi:CheY-like chemotaxis protein